MDEVIKISQYIYRIKLNVHNTKCEDGKYVIYNDGEKHLIETREVEFHAPYDKDGLPVLMSVDEVLKKFEGTTGIESVRGEFKIN